jgi:hypothetical protein
MHYAFSSQQMFHLQLVCCYTSIFYDVTMFLRKGWRCEFKLFFGLVPILYESYHRIKCVWNKKYALRVIILSVYHCILLYWKTISNSASRMFWRLINKCWENHCYVCFLLAFQILKIGCDTKEQSNCSS